MKLDIKISEEIIEKILKKNNLPQLSSFREIETGLTNPVFVINEQLVLRVDTSASEKDAGRFEKEGFLYTVLAKHSVPVPKLFSFDNSKELLSHNFLLLSYIEGETLTDSFERQNHDTKEVLAFQLGNIANKIRSIDLKEFADGEKWLRKKKNWQETVIEEHREYFSLVEKKGYLKEKTLAEIDKTFKQFCTLNMPTEQECLVHGDFSSSNIQVRSGQIVGIFDFEFAILGDPLYDLQKLTVHFQLGEDFDISVFLKGYDKKYFSDKENIRLKMYCFNQGLWEIWATETQRFPFGEKEIIEGKNIIQQTLSFGEM